MYIIIRLIIGCIFVASSMIAIKNSKALHKHILYIIFTGLSVMLVITLSFLPFENLFVTFNSPKAAYEYFCLGKSNIELILEGDDCDFIVDRKNDYDTYLIVPKFEDGWKIGIGSDTRRIIQKLYDGIVVYVYQYKNTNEYFITILDANGGEVAVSDEYSTKFYSLARDNSSLGKTFVTYYAHISNLDSSYNITVNEHKIALKE